MEELADTVSPSAKDFAENLLWEGLGGSGHDNQDSSVKAKNGESILTLRDRYSLAAFKKAVDATRDQVAKETAAAAAAAAAQPAEADAALVRIVLDDRAKQVDPATIRSRDLDDIRPGGLGVYLIREIMDDVQFEHRDGGGMRLTMSKRLTTDTKAADVSSTGCESEDP